MNELSPFDRNVGPPHIDQCNFFKCLKTHQIAKVMTLTRFFPEKNEEIGFFFKFGQGAPECSVLSVCLLVCGFSHWRDARGRIFKKILPPKNTFSGWGFMGTSQGNNFFPSCKCLIMGDAIPNQCFKSLPLYL